MDQYIEEDRDIEIKKQQMAAAAFFFQKTSQYIANERSRSKKDKQSVKFLYNFHKLIFSSIPHLPPCLQKNVSRKSTSSSHRTESDKMQVFVHLIPCAESSSCITIDKANNTITLTDPTPSRKFTASNAPKSFPVDIVINEDWPLIEICSNTLKNVIRSVANGEDACVLSFGNVSSGEHNPMLGSDKSSSTLGIIPCAILWLFNYINTLRQHENSRFSVRISVTEVSENKEICRDLLAKVSTPACDQHMVGTFTPLNTPVELRAVDAEKASYYLDYALNERSKSESSGLSHMLLTLHLYQYHMQNDTGISGGRSRLHLIDLGHGRLSENCESNALSIQGISKVIMAIWSGQRHLPNSESYLTQLLRKVLMTNSGKIQTSMIFNVSGKEVHYNEALQIVQLASKIFRQKMKSSKLSSPLLSDDNSSSDSFSFRRMNKAKDLGVGTKRCDIASFSSDLDATSSSEVSCDTVIYRGHRSDSPPAADRGLADGSSQEQIKYPILETDGKKLDNKLSLFQQKRRSSVKASSGAWPKVAVKKGLKAIKSGQEMWVDGPQAFCTDVIKNEKPVTKEEPNLQVFEKSKPAFNNDDVFENENNDNSVRRNKNCSKHKAQIPEVSLQQYEYQLKNKHSTEKYGNESVLKSMMITNWLSKQPEISEEKDIDILYSKISSRKTSRNKFENDKPYIHEKSEIGKINPKIKQTQADQLKSLIDEAERKTSSKNLSRIEEWIKSVSVESPKRATSPKDFDIVMTQSMYSPTCSPYHLSQNYQASFSTTPLSPPSAPLSCNANSYEHSTNVRGYSVPPDSVSSEIDNECSRLWYFNHPNNERLINFSDPFDDVNNARSSSFSSAVPKCMNRIEPLRRSCQKNPSYNPLNYEIPRMQRDTLLLQGSSTKCSLQRYSTLPLDLYSPKHNKDNQKHLTSENQHIQQISDVTLKPLIETKRNHKEFKKKETKKGFSFFNQLIRNKKTKKESSINRQRKEETNSKSETVDASSPQVMKQNDVHLLDSIEYSRRAGPPLLLSSPYHMVTTTNKFNTQVDSSGHGSDCSSFNGVKATQVSVNFHPETSSFRFAACHRAGSSGYESVVRDSELSSHNDSASECSAPANVLLPNPTLQKNLVDISKTAVPTSVKTTLAQPLKTDEKDKLEFLSHHQESQKVCELIMKEKFNILYTEREELLNDLISAMEFYSIDRDTSRKDMEKNVAELDAGDNSLESLRSTNQMLGSVLNRYQSNICMTTSFLSKPTPES